MAMAYMFAARPLRKLPHVVKFSQEKDYFYKKLSKE